MRSSSAAATAMLALCALAGSAPAASPRPGGFRDALACSVWLAAHGDRTSNPAEDRRCIIAVATTYIDAEENSIPPERQLFADDVSRHRLGVSPVFAAGNRAKLMAENSHQVIAAIRNRQWTVDGDQAWILYDGYLKKDPDKVSFYVAERITLERGLIREILVTEVALAK